MLSVGFGENGTVTYASGYLAVPERGADYPTIGAAAGLERLKTQQNQFIGLRRPRRAEVERPRHPLAVDAARHRDVAAHCAVRAGSGRPPIVRRSTARAGHRHPEQRQARPHHDVGSRQHHLAAAGLHVRCCRRRHLHRDRGRRCLHPRSRPVADGTPIEPAIEPGPPSPTSHRASAADMHPPPQSPKPRQPA